MNIVSVIPLEKGVYPSNLTYFTAKDIHPGDIVHVPLRSRKILGLVVSADDVNSMKSSVKDMDFNLKKITDIKETNIFGQEFLSSVLEINKYYVGRRDYGIATLIPTILKDKYDHVAKFIKNQQPEISKTELASGIQNEKLLFQAPLPDRISYYKTMIRESFALKKSVFIVLPTEHDIDTFYESLSKGIENFSFTLHGGIKEKKLLLKIEELLNSTHPVLIFGTAPYLALKRADIGTIVLEHENANTYKMINRPHVDLRTFAELFASKIKARFIIADSLLRFETIGRKEIEHMNTIGNLSFRTGEDGGGSEKIEIKSRKNPLDETFLKEKNPKKEPFKVLTDEIVDGIKSTISKNKNVFVFALRKGLGSQTICRDCNEILMCENCLAPIVLYLSRDGKKRMFGCNRCHSQIDPDTTCKRCGSYNLASLGIGTDTVTEELKNIFREEKSVKIFQLDKEVAKTAVSAGKIVKEFEESSGSILVGTEMAFFYLKQPTALSVIASFDSLWSIPNYKMSEKVIQIITTLIEQTEYKLMIQTKNAKDSAIVAVMNENLVAFVRGELEDRKKLGYPPYQRFIKITHVGSKQEAVETKKALTETFKEWNPEIFSGFVSKIKDKYVTNTLIKIEPKDWGLGEISSGSKINSDLYPKLSLLPMEFDIFIDPEDLL